MGRQRTSHRNAYDSDASFSDETELFDVEEYQSDDSTEATDLVPEDDDASSDRDDFDVDEQTPLYGGNVHPPEYYRRGIEEPAPKVPYSRYAVKYRPRLLDVEEQWKQFCAEIGLGHYKQVFEAVTVATLDKFLEWAICQKVSKNGRKRRGIKTAGSLETRWKDLQIVYKSVMGRKFAPHIYDDMREVTKCLVEKYGLQTSRRRNRCMTVETLRDTIETTLRTTEKLFDLGELRIYAALFLLLLAPGGSRPESIVLLRFGDIRVILARDPDGGPYNLLLRFTPEFTKTYLGAKESATFTVPEGIFHRSLLLSPHVFLLGILFRHNAFQSTYLTPESIETLTMHPGENELLLPLRSDMDDTYVFRRAVKLAAGYEISHNDPVTYSMMTRWIQSMGRILGIEHNVIMYSLRYFTGNKLDQSSNVSDALRNLCLGHSNSEPFQRHYLGREIGADTFGIVLGERPQQALIEQSCSIAHSISKRRPTRLTPEEAACINADPRIKALERKRRALPRDSKKRKNATREIRNAKQRMRLALLKKTREEWTAKQAVADIDRQLRGEDFPPNPIKAPDSRQHPAQTRLVAALAAPAELALAAQCKRRNEAIRAIMAYCPVEEGRTPRHNLTMATKPRKHEEPVVGSPRHAAVLSVFVSDEKERPRRCFVCVGHAMSFAPDDPQIEKLIDEFYSSSDLTKHFRRRHLSKVPGGGKIECRVCCMSLDNKMHLQNHALQVHGTVS